MELTPENVLEKLSHAGGDYDDGDIPGWLFLNCSTGIALWESDDSSLDAQRFRVTVEEIEPV